MSVLSIDDYLDTFRAFIANVKTDIFDDLGLLGCLLMF